MKKRYAIVQPINDYGEIVMIVSAVTDEAAQRSCEDGQIWTEVARQVSARDSIKLSTMRPNKRPQTPCTLSRTEVPADGATHVALSQMRPGTQIRVSGPVSHQFIVDDGSAQITFPRAGVYTITATAPFPALPKPLTINAS